MAAVAKGAGGVGEGSGSWPIILHQSLANSELHQLLKSNRHHKIRVSTATLPHTCIFPLSSVVFMVESVAEAVTEWPPSERCQLDPHLIQRLSKLAAMFHQQYVLLLAAMLGTQELAVLTALQRRFLAEGLNFLPAHSMSECVESMLSIVKVTCQPLCGVVKERFQHAMQAIMSENTVLSALKHINLSPHDTTVLFDGCGSLHNIALSSPRDLTELTSLGSATAITVHNFFNHEVY